jgi:hypothetical protein
MPIPKVNAGATSSPPRPLALNYRTLRRLLLVVDSAYPMGEKHLEEACVKYDAQIGTWQTQKSACTKRSVLAASISRPRFQACRIGGGIRMKYAMWWPMR